MSGESAASVARAFWQAIDAADFAAAAAMMTPDATVDWPQSNERMPSPDAWREVNANYPGRWRVRLHDIIAEGEKVVVHADVFDGGESATVLSIMTIRGGKIRKLVEYWPEPYAAPAWRTQWVVPIDPSGTS